MDELKDLFLSIDEEEFAQLIQDTDITADEAFSEKIKSRVLPSAKENTAVIRSFPLIRLLPVAAAICILITGALIFSLNRPQVPVTTTTLPSSIATTYTAQPPEENPLMVAISSGDDALIENLLTLPGLVSQDTLDFAIVFSDLLSYETISKIAQSVEELIGSTGLDSLLESALFGDSEKVIAELKKRDSMLMTPLEKLAFFFAVAFCDSETVDAFVSRGYDINTTDLHGNSIYAIAEKYGNEDTMQYAVSKGITS